MEGVSPGAQVIEVKPGQGDVRLIDTNVNAVSQICLIFQGN